MSYIDNKTCMVSLYLLNDTGTCCNNITMRYGKETSKKINQNAYVCLCSVKPSYDVYFMPFVNCVRCFIKGLLLLAY